MNHHNLAPKNLTKSELRRAQAEAHNAELRRKMEAGDKTPSFEFPVESILPQNGLLLIEMLIDKYDESLIVVPDNVEEKPDRDRCRMVVIAVGPEWKDDEGKIHPQKYKVGQELLPNPTGGRYLPERKDGRTFMMFRQDEIMAVIDRSKADAGQIPADFSPEC